MYNDWYWASQARFECVVPFQSIVTISPFFSASNAFFSCWIYIVSGWCELDRCVDKNPGKIVRRKMLLFVNFVIEHSAPIRTYRNLMFVLSNHQKFNKTDFVGFVMFNLFKRPQKGVRNSNNGHCSRQLKLDSFHFPSIYWSGGAGSRWKRLPTMHISDLTNCSHFTVCPINKLEKPPAFAHFECWNSCNAHLPLQPSMAVRRLIAILKPCTSILRFSYSICNYRSIHVIRMGVSRNPCAHIVNDTLLPPAFLKIRWNRLVNWNNEYVAIIKQ